MLFVLIGRDAPDSRDKRPGVRLEHLEYWRPLDEVGRIRIAGPLTDFAGSLFVLEAESFEHVQKLANNDPYTKAGVFESYEIHPFREVFPMKHDETGPSRVP